ncbi:alpha/beta hydrolase [Simiduia litorea]
MGSATVLTFLIVGVATSTQATLFIVNQLALTQEMQRYTSIAYGSEAAQQLDVYTPINTTYTSSLPVVIFFYGGCWGACETLPKEDYAFVAQTLLEHGIVVVIADYRLFPTVRFLSIIEDARNAVEWTHQHIAEYGGNPKQLFLMGHSAGAHLAAMLAMNQAYLSQDAYADLNGFIGLAGPYNFLPFDEPYMPELFGPPLNEHESQPITYVDGSEPPSLLLYGDADTRVKPVNIDGLFKRLEAANSPVQKRIYQGVDHADIIASFAMPLRRENPVVLDAIQFISASANN